MRILLALLLVVVSAPAASAQFKDVAPDKGAQLGREVVTRIRIGVVVNAASLTHHAVATAPVPTDWPEQRVQIVAEEVSPAVKSLNYRLLAGGGVKQMVAEIPQLLGGQEAKALITFEVTRRILDVPPDTTIFSIPKKLDRQMLPYVGASPYIESRHPKVTAAAKDALADIEPANDWEKVKTLFDWTRENITYATGEMKGAARGLYDKQADTEDITGIFVALCRSQKIPARMVFTYGHCYAEFYLEDDEGQGHWLPAQLAGVPTLGFCSESRPIIQKGDNYKTPETPKERQRMVTEYFTAAGRGGKPSVKFVSEIVQ